MGKKINRHDLLCEDLQSYIHSVLNYKRMFSIKTIQMFDSYLPIIEK